MLQRASTPSIPSTLTLRLPLPFPLSSAWVRSRGSNGKLRTRPTSPLYHRPSRRTHGLPRFFLLRSKTDKSSDGVSIVVAAIGDSAYAVRHMTTLLRRIPGPLDSPLFTFVSGPFTRTRVMNALNRRLANLGIPTGSYCGHSFRRSAAQHAHEMQVPLGEVQAMGRWASDWVERYYRRSRKHLIRLQRQFHTGSEVAFELPGLPPHILKNQKITNIMGRERRTLCRPRPSRASTLSESLAPRRYEVRDGLTAPARAHATQYTAVIPLNQVASMRRSDTRMLTICTSTHNTRDWHGFAAA